MANRPITDFAQNILKPYINNQDKAYAANIAPVETSPATSAHTAGTQIIYNGVLYDVTADIAANDALATTGAGANIAAADDVSEQISNVKQALANEVTTRVKVGAHNLLNPDTFVLGNETGGSPEIRVSTRGSREIFLKTGESIVVKITNDSTMRFIVLAYDAAGNKLYESTWYGSETTYTATQDCYIILNIKHQNEGAITIAEVRVANILVRLASDTDPTFQPYAKTNQQLTKDDNGLTANAFANGCVNLLGGSPTSQTVNGGTTPVYFTVNNDGTISVHTNGVATTGVANYIYTVPTIGIGRYKLSGCPTGGSDNDYFLTVNKDGGWNDASREYGNGNNITVTSSGITQVNISIRNGASIPSSSPKVFKPMITVADMPNSDYNHYVPYAKSNKELTDDVYSDWGEVPYSSFLISGVTGGFLKYKKIGNILIVNFEAVLPSNFEFPANTSLQMATLPEGFRPKYTFRSRGYFTNGYTGYDHNIQIQVSENSGKIVALTPTAVTLSAGATLWAQFVVELA